MSSLFGTNRSSALLAALVAILVVGAAGAGFYVSGSEHSTTSTLTSSTSVSSNTASGEPFIINYSSLIVGYKGGLYELGFQDATGKPVDGVVTILYTPVQAVLCSGYQGGLSFANCLPGAGKSYTFTPATGGSFPAGTSYTGFDSGAGPGSAVAGATYALNIRVTYTGGTTSDQNFSVFASAGA